MNHMKDKKSKAKRTVSGVITVEMTYIVPMIFFIFVMIIYTVFYYHDKNILIGAAGETAVVAVQMTRKPDTDGKADLTEFYRERIQGKLILFPHTEVSIEESEKRVRVNVYAERKKMKLQIRQSASIVEPERKIRRKRLLEEVKDSIGSESTVEKERGGT